MPPAVAPSPVCACFSLRTRAGGWLDDQLPFWFMQTTRPFNDAFNGNEFLTEFSYMFHWRWAARFLINAGVYTMEAFKLG